MKTFFQSIANFFRESSMQGWLILLGIIVVIVLQFLRSCDNTSKEGVTEPINTVRLKSSISVAFMDAKDTENSNLDNVRVTIVDPAGMVVSANGIQFNEITLPDGVMTLALKGEAKLDDRNPYRFTINVEADGYSSNSRNVLLTSEEDQYIIVFMAKLDDPPLGVTAFTGASGLTGGALLEGATLAPSNPDAPSNLQVSIPRGTVPILCEGEDPTGPFPENLNYQISYAVPNVLASSRTFTGGPLLTDAVDMDGNIIASPSNPGYFESAGWINIEMDADGSQINGFTKPLEVTMPIPDSLVNPETGQFYRVGDEIGIWSLNNRGGWREENIARVENSSSGLLARLSINHLSTWNLDFKVDACNGDPSTDRVRINYENNTGSDVNRYTEIIRYSQGSAFGWNGGNSYAFTATIDPIDIINAPIDEEIAVVVYNSNAGPNNGIYASSCVFAVSCGCNVDCTGDPCDGAGTVPLVLPETNTPRTRSIEFDFISPGTGSGGADEILSLCNNGVWYKRDSEAGDPRFGGRLNNSGIVRLTRYNDTSEFGEDATYDFQLWFAGEFNGMEVSQVIEFSETDFRDDPDVQASAGTPEIITGSVDLDGNGVIDASEQIEIQRWYDDSSIVHHFRIDLNGASFTIAECE